MKQITVNQFELMIDKIADPDLKKGLARAASLLEKRAKQNAPVGSGELRRSIYSEVDDTTVYVGSDLEYAPYVEFGTGLFSSLGNGRQDVPWRYQDAQGEWHTTYGMEPQPYLHPALEESKDEIKGFFIDSIKEALK